VTRLRAKFPTPLLFRWAERELHVLHLGKTGGTALKSALKGVQRLGGGRVICHDHGTTLGDIPRGSDVVFSVRDPVSRLISGFNSRKRCGRPRYDVPWTEGEAKAFRAFADPDTLARGLIADDHAVRDKAMQAFDAIQHVRDRYWRWFTAPGILRHRADDILFVARQERLSRDFAEFVDLAGLPAYLTLPDDPVARHSGDRPPELQDPARAILRAATAQDYGFIRFCERELGLRPYHPEDRRAPAPEPYPTPLAATAR